MISHLQLRSRQATESGRRQLNLLFVGCGALAETYYAPALIALGEHEGISVRGLVDPSAGRLGKVAAFFPQASRFQALEDARPGDFDFAIVASPQSFHAPQSIKLLREGLHVLCEKPMASTAAEAGRMVDAARESQRLLGVGLFRRFFPSTEFIKQLVDSGPLGKAVSFAWSEGGAFNWPAAAPSFFQKALSSGGVSIDLGIHVLDLLLHWFGAVDEADYEDDAMGGLEANARFRLRFACGVEGTVRLSRDTSIPNGARIEFEHGSVRLEGASADSVTIQLDGCSRVARASLHEMPEDDAETGSGFGPPARTYCQSFMEQIRNFCRAIRGDELLRVPGEGAIAAQQLIEGCYASRRLMCLPWLSDAEREGAQRLAGASPPHGPAGSV